jgi:hypothetical protein
VCTALTSSSRDCKYRSPEQLLLSRWALKFCGSPSYTALRRSRTFPNLRHVQRMSTLGSRADSLLTPRLHMPQLTWISQSRYWERLRREHLKMVQDISSSCTIVAFWFEWTWTRCLKSWFPAYPHPNPVSFSAAKSHGSILASLCRPGVTYDSYTTKSRLFTNCLVGSGLLGNQKVKNPQEPSIGSVLYLFELYNNHCPPSQ